MSRAFSAPVPSLWTGQAARVSVPDAGIQAAASSRWPALSADGRYVAFVSAGTDLVPGDTNNVADVFVRDRLLGTTARVSIGTGGSEANGESGEPSISADGRYVAFASLASNLVPGPGAQMDIFVHDRVTGQTERVSQDSIGTAGNAGSTEPAISPDGRYVSFTSLASNLVSNDTNNSPDVFVHDRQSGETRLVSVAMNGGEALGGSGWSAIDSDGRHVAFLSSAANLVADDTNGKWDVFVRDLTVGATVRVNVATDGTEANDDTSPGVENQPSLSVDGRFVAFAASASNLVAGDTNNTSDIFVRDLQSAATERVSRSTAGVQGDGASRRAALSADGRYVAFASDATTLIAGDAAGVADIFVHDRDTATTVRVGLPGEGTEADSASSLPAISGDARFVAFASDASNLVAGDTNGTTDIFVVGGVSVTPASPTFPAASGDGTLADTFVYPDAPWTAVSSESWIRINGQSAPSGTGTVSYNVELNHGLARTGVLTVAGWTVIVQQAIAEIPLTAEDGNASTLEDSPVSGALVATAPVGQPLSFTIVTNGTRGTATLNAASGLFTYTPLPDVSGTDTFTFKVNDGTADSNVATVTVTITPVNDAPVASNSNVAATEDTPAAGTLVAADVDGPVLAYSLLTTGTQGHVVLTDAATGAFIYTPTPNANGIDSFTFAATDGSLASNVATVSLTIAAVNDAPVAHGGVVTASTAAPAAGVLAATDVDGDVLSYRLVSAAALGQLDLNGSTGAFTYTPIAGAGGYEAIAFEARDQAGATSVAVEHVFVVTANPQWPGQTVRASVTASGAQANRESEHPSSSADGRYLAFASLASNLVPLDTNNARDIFVRDRQTGETTRVSVSSSGAQANNASVAPAMSANGRYVAFASQASNLVADDTNGAWDIFVHDRDTKTTTRVNVSNGGEPAGTGSWSDAPALSADGRYVAFISSSATLVPGDTNDADDVFVHDRETGRTERVTIADNGAQADSWSYAPRLSADGRFVAFVSSATNLVPSDTNDADDIFVLDRETRHLVRASLASDGTPADDWSQQPALSADGRFVTFASFASNLVPDDTNSTADVFVRDLIGGRTERVSLAGGAIQANGWSDQATVSADGRYVAFMSSASDLVPDDTNGVWEVFVRDRQTRRTTRVSVASSGAQANGWSDEPSISADGRFVTFRANATNLVTGDTNGRADIFASGGVSVAPATEAFKARGGTGTVDVGFVYGGTAWAATSQESWITVTGQTAGTASYSVERNTGAPRSGTLTVAAQPVTITQDENHVPFAADRTIETDETAAIVDRLGATDPDGDPVTFVLLSTGTLGTATITDPLTGAFTYTPRQAATGTDTFAFQVNDGFADSNVATVTVIIKPVNFPPVAPVALDGALQGTEDVVATGVLVATDVDSPALRYSLVTNGSAGVVVITNPATGAYTYTPNVNAFGTDTFTFAASDGALSSNVATVTVTIAPVNDAPVARIGVVMGPGSWMYVPLLATDVDFDTLTYRIVSGPTQGTFNFDPTYGYSYYSSNPDGAGYDSFTFEVQDPGGLSSTAVVHLFVVEPTAQWSGQTVRGSVASAGSQGNNDSEQGSLSADGRFMVFVSAASNLVPGDTNGAQDVFVRDRRTGLTTRVSVGSGGVQAAGDSFRPAISPGGRYVAFVSSASNLVPDDTNEADDVFVHDRESGLTTRVNVASDGSEAESSSSSDAPALSADGRFVAFTSTASNLVPGDTNGTDDVFVRDRTTGRTVRVSVATDGSQADSWSYRPSINADGQFVAFTSSASNLVTGDTNGVDDVFLADRQSGEVVRVSRGYFGGSADDWSDQATISADGRYVAFASFASNLAWGDTNGTSDVFLYDRVYGGIQRISLTSAGTNGNGWSEQPSLSADGRYLAFLSAASNLVDGDTNGAAEIFVRDLYQWQTTRVSVKSGGAQANGWSDQPAISADGHFVAFRSTATNLVDDDSNGRADVFVAGGVSVTPRANSFTARGGSGVVNVAVAYGAQPWTATSHAPWITVTAQTASQVTYDVAPNNGADRIGTLTVADVPVTITQFENRTPFASNTNLWAYENVASDGQLWGWDPDYGDPLTFSIVTNGTLGTATITNPSTGEFRYTPLTNAYGDDTFTFKVSDGFRDSNVGTVTVTIARSPLPFSQGPNLGTYSVGEVQIPLAATGGTGTYQWYTNSTLPEGLALRPDLPSWFPPGATAGIIGVATLPGSYAFQLTVTNDGIWSSQDATLKITALSVGDAYDGPDGFVGTPYTFGLTALNNNGPARWAALPNQPLPAGLTLSPDGVLSGTPTEPGTYTINVSLSDTVDTVYRGLTIKISAIEITTDGTLPNGSRGAAYTATISARGGSGTYSFSAANPPPGLVMNPSSGELSGTIAAGRGPWSFTVTAADTANPALSYTKQMSIDVVDSPPSLPSLYGGFIDCTVGVPCIRNVGVGTGTAPFTWDVSNLPPGMRFRSGAGMSTYLHASDLELFGTPTSLGSYDVLVTVTDASGQTAKRTFPLHVSRLLQTDWLSDGTIDVPYSRKLRVIGGVWYSWFFGFNPYFATLTDSHLPVGLSPDPAGFVVSGTPGESGHGFHADFRFSDWFGNSLQTQNYFSIAGAGGGGGASPIEITTGPDLGTVTLGSFYSNTLSACCAATYAWSHIGGTLPLGVTLSSSGLLSGTATGGGIYTFLIQATDAANNANYAVRQFTLIVTSVAITTDRSLPYGNVGSPYQGAQGGLMLTATGGFGHTWTLLPGSSLPPGMTLQWNGFLSGTPTAGGLFFFGVKVTNLVFEVAIAYFELPIYPAGVLPPLAVVSGPDLGTFSIGEVQLPLTAKGGDGTYVWSLHSGSLPPGLSLRTDMPSWFPSNASAGLIGIATTEGTYHFRLAVSSAGQTAYQDATLTISLLVVKDQYQLPDAFVGAAYSQRLTALNNKDPVTWASNNTLPSWLTLSADGVLSGTPDAAGSHDLWLRLTDGVDTVNRGVRINVSAIEITSDAIAPNATQGLPYTTTITARGGSGLYWFSSQNLPSGLILNSSSGVISGTAFGGIGPASFVVTAVDRMTPVLSSSKRMSVDTIGVPPVLPAINPYGSALDDCTVGIECSRGIAVFNGGRAPFRWTAEGLPSGMSVRWVPGTTSFWIAPGDAEIWGTASVAGEYPVRVTVTDADNVSATNVYPLRVSVLEHTCCLANGAINVPYSQTLRVIGGSGSYSATSVGGQLPAGVALNPAERRLSGTPAESGDFSSVFRFTDGAGQTLQTTDYFSIGGSSTSSIGTGSNLGSALAGNFYSRTLAACCYGPYNWSVVGGTLPPGLSLSPSGVLSGTPTVANTYQFLVRATTFTNPLVPGDYAQRQFTLVVTTLSITSGLPFGNVGTLYSSGLTATGATGPLTWTLAPSNYLPPGLTLGTNGVVFGTPTDTGQFVFTVNVSDTAGHIASRTFSVPIYPAGVYPPVNWTFGSFFGPFPVGTLQFQLPDATGGLPPYTYSITPGSPEIPGMRVQNGQPLPTNFGSAIAAGYIGVITTPGTYTTSLRVTDSLGNTFDRAITITISALNIVAENTLPPATIATPYTFAFTPFGGSGSYAWFANPLPAGLTLDSSTGVLSGMPGVAGTFGFTISLFDLTTFAFVSRNVTLVVAPFDIAPGGVLPQGNVGVAYSQMLSAPGCGIVCTWTMFPGAGGSIPAGISIKSSTGEISGLPTAVFNSFFTIQASGSGGTTQRVFSLPIVSSAPQPLSIVTGPSLGFQTVGQQVATPLIAQGGTRPYTWSLVSGTLPAGVTLQPLGETVGGLLGPGLTYLAGRLTNVGAYDFTLRVADSAGGSVTRTFTWNISALNYQYFTLPVAAGNPATVVRPLVYNVAYAQPLLVLGGTGRYTWAATGLPSGLTLDPATGIVSGTPLNTGSFAVSIQVTDDAGNTTVTNATFNVAGPTPIAITFGGGPSFTASRGNSFSANLLLSGGTGPYTVTPLTALPPGFAVLSGASVLSNSFLGTNYFLAGTPLSTGSFSVILEARDAAGNVGARTFTVNVVPVTLFTSPVLSDASVGRPYVQRPVAWASTGTVTWSIAAGSALPPGLSLSADGLIEGTPTAAGTYIFTLNTSDGSGSIAPLVFTLRVLTFDIADTQVLPPIAIGVPFSYTFTAIGGTPAKAWFGSGLPAGVTLSSAGTLSGVITANTNVFPFNVTLTDGGVSLTRRFVLFAHLANPLQLTVSLTSTALADITVGFNANYALTPSGGTPPYVWSVAPGSTLPPGLNLMEASAFGSPIPASFPSGSTILTGAPTTPGQYSFDLIVTDFSGAEVRRTFTLNVSVLGLLAGSPRLATAGTPYAQQFTAVGGTPPYTFAISAMSATVETLPPGLTLSPEGLISGTPTSNGTYGFVLRVTDSAGHSYARGYSFAVNGPGSLVITSVNPPDTWVGIGRRIQSLGTSGPSTYTWSLVSGSLPPGAVLAPGTIVGASATTTVLAGVPTEPGVFTYTLRAADNAGPAVAEHVFTSRVSSLQVVSPPTAILATAGTVDLPGARVDEPYRFAIKVAGGVPPYTFTESPFVPLPRGLTLGLDGVISGTPESSGQYSIAPIISDSAGQMVNALTMTLVVVPSGAPFPFVAVATATAPASLFDASVGGPYGLPLDPGSSPVSLARYGVAPYTWTVAPGSALPEGLALLPGANSLPAYLAGTPTTAGSYSFSLVAQDAAGQSLTLPVTLAVSPLAVTPGSLAPGVVGTPYSVTLVPAGGTAPYAIQTSATSDMPPGLTLTADGLLSGVPTYPGSFLIAVVVTDAASHSVTKVHAITIDNAAGESPAVSLSPSSVLLSYVQGAAGGTALVSVNTTSGPLAFTASVAGIPGATVSPTSGTAPGTVTLNLDTAALAPGTYVGLLAVSAPDSANQTASVPVIVTIAPGSSEF